MSLNGIMKMFFYIFIIVLGNVAWADKDVPDNIVFIRENSISIIQKDEDIAIRFNLDVKDGFFAYKEKFEVSIDGFKTIGLEIDPIVTFFDKTFQKNKEGVRNSAQVIATLKHLGQTPPDTIHLQVVYQACTPEYCLFPQQTTQAYQLNKNDQRLISDGSMPEWFKKGLIFSLFFSFLAGFLTSLTPCVYPMLPITLAVLGTKTARTHTEGFLRSFTYVLGMALTYAILGAIAGTTGFMFGALLANKYFLLGTGIILFGAALSMFDVFDIQTPQFLQSRLNVEKTSTSYLAIFISGLFSGLIVGPCVGPVLVGIIGYVSQKGSLVLGFSLLFSFAFGLGSLILVFGTFSSLMSKIPRSGGWMILVKKVIGLVFLGMILYFFSPIMKVRSLTQVGFGIAALFAIIVFIKDLRADRLKPLLAAIYKSIFMFSLIAVGVLALFSNERFERLFGYSTSTFISTHWDVYSEEQLNLAKKNQQKVVLDFYAEWCAACREMKKQTFSDRRVIDYSSEIRWIYFDATQPTAELEDLKKKYKILGLPSILFFDETGGLREDLTLNGFEDPDLFLKRLDKFFGKEQK